MLVLMWPPLSQISVLLKPTHLPPLPSYALSLAAFPFDYTSQRFYMAEGIAMAVGTVTKYTQGARFLCTEETCPFSEGSKKEMGTISKPS